MAPAYAVVALAVAALLPLLTAEHRHWLQRDASICITAAPGNLSKYEAQTTKLLRERLLKSLGK